MFVKLKIIIDLDKNYQINFLIRYISMKIFNNYF